MSVKIYVASHIEPEYALPKNYEFILTGGFGIKKCDVEGYITHNSIEGNISKKNKNYSELTAVYTIKQLIEVGAVKEDFVGFVHYRRFFLSSLKYLFYIKLKATIKRRLEFKDISNYIFSDKTIPVFFSEKNIFVAKKTKFNMTLYEQFAMLHDVSDLDKAISQVLDLYPDYSRCILEFKNSKHIYCCNMMIAKTDVFKSYCDWLFPVLFQLELKIELENRNGYQERVFGYISERLFNLWLLYNKENYEIIEMPVARILNAKN